MTTELLIFRNLDFDGIVFVRYEGRASFKSIRYQLQKDDAVISEQDVTRPGETAHFDIQSPGVYRAKALFKHADGSTSVLDSSPLTIQSTTPWPASAKAGSVRSLKGGHCFYDNIDNYYLERAG
ncbi:hypothetical protein P349_04707 [Enterobacter sp. DC4]|uniref:hypothetical protein n=1 Tax=Enterobacter sp. DC4 TaxID=1395580 RepID=UPI0003ECFAEA|nr:hypothetical protein [Enterobacter sp. DC4]EWG67243.1 hypothetical protein P349_04707 [Enterobacter sp. DC4]